MARNSTLAAFLVTICVALPAGWHAVDANLQTDGKRVRPLQQSFTIDGTKVTLEVDRGLVITGDSVTAKLVAFSDTPKPVVVDLTLLQSNNYAGERVESPQVAIDHEKLTLAAAPGGGPPVTTKLTLGHDPGQLAQTDDFRIYVAPHGHKPPKSTDFDNRLDYSHDVEAGTAAAVNITGWSGNSFDIAIAPQGPITLDQPFTVLVRIKNTSGSKLQQAPFVELGTLDAQLGNVEAGADFDIQRIDDRDDHDGHALGLGRTEISKFVVVPKTKTAKQVTFVAQAISGGQPGRVIAGAMDAKTFAVTETKPAIASK